MKKIFNAISLIGLLICNIPALQLLFDIINPTYDEYTGGDFFANIIFIVLLSLFATAPIIIFYYLIKSFYIEKGASLWGQTAVGFLAILLYLIPILISLTWVADFDGFRTSDGLNIIGFFVMISLTVGVSIIPTVLLIKCQRKSS